MQSATPIVFLLRVWPLPRSLATTCGISVDFFSSPYLDVSVQAVPLLHLWIQCRIPGHDSGWIAPFRHPWIIAYLQLPMAFRSLSRLSSAPSAKAFTLCSSLLDLDCFHNQSLEFSQDVLLYKFIKLKLLRCV